MRAWYSKGSQRSGSTSVAGIQTWVHLVMDSTLRIQSSLHAATRNTREHAQVIRALGPLIVKELLLLVLRQSIVSSAESWL